MKREAHVYKKNKKNTISLSNLPLTLSVIMLEPFNPSLSHGLFVQAADIYINLQLFCTVLFI